MRPHSHSWYSQMHVVATVAIVIKGQVTACFKHWIYLLVLYSQFVVGIIVGIDISTQYPTNSICTTWSVGNSTAIRLNVDCQKGRDIYSGQLSDELDSMLSSNLTYDRSLSFSIVISSLTHVPRSICRLTTLTELLLDNNRLTRLPDDCLTNLSNLSWFAASNNAIETLQNGVFDGLTNLRYLDLGRNRISSIGLPVFATSSNLSNLFTINLSENALTSLDTWFYDRGIIGKFKRKVRIDLSHNEISKFTNKMGHKLLAQHKLCSLPFLHRYVDLRYNKIQHIGDIFNGWQPNCKEIDLRNVRMSLFIINTLRNNIICDCIKYNFYRIVQRPQYPERYKILIQDQPCWRTFKIDFKCNLTDPLTRK